MDQNRKLIEILIDYGVKIELKLRLLSKKFNYLNFLKPLQKFQKNAKFHIFKTIFLNLNKF